MEVTEEIMVVKIKPSSYQYSLNRVNRDGMGWGGEGGSKTTFPGAVCRSAAGKEEEEDATVRPKKAFITKIS